MEYSTTVSDPIMEFTSYSNYLKTVKMQHEMNGMKDDKSYKKTISIDAKGVICISDVDFMDASYPVKTYFNRARR